MTDAEVKRILMTVADKYDSYIEYAEEYGWLTLKFKNRDEINYELIKHNIAKYHLGYIVNYALLDKETVFYNYKFVDGLLDCDAHYVHTDYTVEDIEQLTQKYIQIYNECCKMIMDCKKKELIKQMEDI